jgi:hypothetical protein
LYLYITRLAVALGARAARASRLCLATSRSSEALGFETGKRAFGKAFGTWWVLWYITTGNVAPCNL